MKIFSHFPTVLNKMTEQTFARQQPHRGTEFHIHWYTGESQIKVAKNITVLREDPSHVEQSRDSTGPYYRFCESPKASLSMKD